MAPPVRHPSEKKRPLLPTRTVNLPAPHQLIPVTAKACLAAFRALITSPAVATTHQIKNFLQHSRAAALAIRSERTRLLEARYYRSRAKLRLPKLRVRRAERKREGLRLFARHTLKRPKTISGKAKLLLPVTDMYTTASCQLAPATLLTDKDISTPERMFTFHPRVRFRGSRHYEFGIIYSGRRRRAIKRNARHRRFMRQLVRKAKGVPAVAATPRNNFEQLTRLIARAKAMNTAALTQQFFKKLTFSSVAQQETAKVLFLARLQTAKLKLSSTNSA
jgi:hypothetical protein